MATWRVLSLQPEPRSVVLQVFTYDGRQVCAFKPQGLSAEGVSRQLVSLSNETLATAAGCSVRCYETAQGRSVGDPLNHSSEVKVVCLSQVGRSLCQLCN